MVPPVPVMVIVEVPTAAVEATVIVIVEVPEPGAAIEDGLKETVTPAGWPEADSAMAALKPLETAVVTVELPGAPLRDRDRGRRGRDREVRRRGAAPGSPTCRC